MSDREWFRKERWTRGDEGEFFARLERARTPNQAQYLRIQAYHLQRTKNGAMAKAALELLDLLVKEYPDPIQLAPAHHQKADCLEFLGRVDEAEAAYHDAFEALNAFPHTQPDLPTDFALFVLRHRKVDEYDEALARLPGPGEKALLPLLRYRSALARALLLNRTGRPKEAATFAMLALEETGRETSGLPYHPRVGLVTQKDESLHEELLRIGPRPGSDGGRMGDRDSSLGRTARSTRIALGVARFATYSGLGAAIGWFFGHPGFGGALGAGLWVGIRSPPSSSAAPSKASRVDDRVRAEGGHGVERKPETGRPSPMQSNSNQGEQK